MSWGKGQQVNNGRYEILDRIGTGGFGVTYKAIDLKHPTPNSIVAIKTLNEKRQRQANFKQLQENFLNEAMALAKCSHPHVIKVDRMFFEGKILGMVVDYIEGESLEDYLIDRGKLSEPKAVEIIQKIGGAVSYVHAQKLLHRDIKPANILIKSNGEPILIDFGLAREFVAGIARSMTSDRTPHYSPPEQAERRGDFQPPLDIYALAATLYTCVTGDLPPLAEIRIVRDSLIPPQQLNSGISDGVNRAILTGMALKPEDRSSTVEEWLELFQQTPIPAPKQEKQPRSLPVQKKTPPPKNKIRQSDELMEVCLSETPIIDLPLNSKLLDIFQPLPSKSKKIEILKKPNVAEYIEDLGSGVKLEMVSMPAGSFLMGQTSAEQQELIKLYGEEKYKEWFASELPQHLVNVPGFYMGKYPITQNQYLAIMGENPSHFQGGDLPVERVSWLNAQVFCDKLNTKSGQKYRLPSEAEWEYACRAGTTTAFAFGETITSAVVNYHGNYPYGGAANGEYRGKTTPVGIFHPNLFGLYDMHGNVWEWCLDEWVDNYHGAPTDGSARGSINSREENKNRLLRGGSWNTFASSCRCVNRITHITSFRSNIIGFRVVCQPSRIS